MINCCLSTFISSRVQSCHFLWFIERNQDFSDNKCSIQMFRKKMNVNAKTVFSQVIIMTIESKSMWKMIAQINKDHREKRFALANGQVSWQKPPERQNSHLCQHCWLNTEFYTTWQQCWGNPKNTDFFGWLRR